MARSAIAVTTIVRAGVTQPAQTTADASNKHYIAGNAGDLLLEVVSSDAGPQTVVIEASPDLQSDSLAVSNLTLTVAAGATKYFGPFKTKTFKQAADNDYMYVNPSVSTNLKFRCYKLTNVSS